MNNCATCGAEGVKSRCGKCKNIYYCNVKCQTSDWIRHKGICSTVSSSTEINSNNVARSAARVENNEGEIKDKRNGETVIPTNLSNVVRTIREIEMENKKLERRIVIVEGSEATEETIPINEIDSTWKDCVVPRMIGVPVKYKRWRNSFERPIDREVGIFLLVDPVSGLAAPEYQICGCGVLAFALEKQDFSVNLFWDLYSYIFHLMDYYGESNFNYESYRLAKLNSKSFYNYQEEEHQIQADFRKNQRRHFAMSH